MYTLRGWIEVEVGLDSGVTLDAAHAVLSDAAREAFGSGVFDRVREALADEGRNPEDLSALIGDDLLADRVLRRLHERMVRDDDAPGPPDGDHTWSAYAPDDPTGARTMFRRAVRRRALTARWASVTPRRRRIAGSRAR
jgi:hypothetical protein